MEKRLLTALALAAALLAAAPTAYAQQRYEPACELPPTGRQVPAAPEAISGNTVLDRTNLALPGSGTERVALRLEAGRTYVIETYNLTVSTDTVMEVRRATAAQPSPSDQLVGQNDDVQSGTLWSRVRITPTASGDYYANVRAYDASTGGTFSLRVIEVAAPTAGSVTAPK